MSPEPSPTQHAEDAEYYRRTLHALIDMGTGFARSIHAQATQPATPDSPAPTPTPEQAASFDRIARCIRRTILLAQHVAQPPAAHRREHARRRILRAVEDRIEHIAEAEHADALHAELLERLDGPDLDDDIQTRPIPDIVADIVRDLGLLSQPGFTPYKRRTPADIATLCARAAAPRPPQRSGGPAPADRQSRPRPFAVNPDDWPARATRGP